MQRIISVNNQLVKTVQALQLKKNRNETGLFLIEGYKGVSEAVDFGIKIESIFIGEDFDKEINNFDEDKIYVVTEAVLKKISTTTTPPDIVAVAHQLKFSLEDMMSTSSPLIVLLENIKDPGNLGTIIRTAKAGGASGIIVTDETVDIYNPKTVRASTANLWKIPIVHFPDKINLKQKLNKFKNFQYVATLVDESPKSEIYYYINYNNPTVLLFGSEASGLSKTLAQQSDKNINIPMDKSVESLNLSVSVGVVLYESLRQRKFTAG